MGWWRGYLNTRRVAIFVVLAAWSCCSGSHRHAPSFGLLQGAATDSGGLTSKRTLVEEDSSGDRGGSSQRSSTETAKPKSYSASSAATPDSAADDYDNDAVGSSSGWGQQGGGQGEEAAATSSAANAQKGEVGGNGGRNCGEDAICSDGRRVEDSSGANGGAKPVVSAPPPPGAEEAAAAIVEKAAAAAAAAKNVSQKDSDDEDDDSSSSVIRTPYPPKWVGEQPSLFEEIERASASSIDEARRLHRQRDRLLKSFFGTLAGSAVLFGASGATALKQNDSPAAAKASKLLFASGSAALLTVLGLVSLAVVKEAKRRRALSKVVRRFASGASRAPDVTYIDFD